MEQYLQYQQLLSKNIAEQEEEAQALKERFEGKLAETDEQKALIERTTDAIGGLFMVKPSEALAKVSGRLAEKGVQQVKDFVGKGVEELKTKVTRGIEPSTEAPETQPTETELTTISEPEETMNIQDLIMEQDPEISDPTEGMSAQQTRRTDGTETQEGEGGQTLQEAEQSGQEATTNATGESTTEATSEAVGDAGLDSGLEEAGSILADIDPVTAIFGLLFGIGSLVGGMEGANSIKNPPVPKIPPMAQSSVQFGF
jgi:hypothetical protein